MFFISALGGAPLRSCQEPSHLFIMTMSYQEALSGGAAPSSPRRELVPMQSDMQGVMTSSQLLEWREHLDAGVSHERFEFLRDSSAGFYPALSPFTGGLPSKFPLLPNRVDLSPSPSNFPPHTSSHHVQTKPPPHVHCSDGGTEEALPEHGGPSQHYQASRSNQGVGHAVVQEYPSRPEKGKNILPLPTALIKGIEHDYAQRAVVGMIFGPRPPIDSLRAWIRHNWESIGIEVVLTQAIRNNSYIFLLKTPEMALKALAAGQWVIRSSPLCLFKWTPDFKPEGNNQIRYPVWVEFPDLPFQYYPILNHLAEPLGKVLGVRPASDINPRWHPQVLVEIDLSKELPSYWTLVREDGIEFTQEIFYKQLPNACFHCGVKGHIIRDCPKRTKSKDPPAAPPVERQEAEEIPRKEEGPPSPRGNSKFQPPKKKGAQQARKPLLPIKNHFALLERLDPQQAEPNQLALMGGPQMHHLTLERLEQEVEHLDSQVENTPLVKDRGKAVGDGPVDMDLLKDNKRPPQGPHITPEKLTKEKRDKKKQFR